MMKYEEEENKLKKSNDLFSMPDSPTGMKVSFVRFIFKFCIVFFIGTLYNFVLDLCRSLNLVDHWICVDHWIL